LEKKKNEKTPNKAGYELELCKQYVEKISEELKLDIGEVKINRSKPYMAPKCMKNGKDVFWVLPTYGGFFRIYLFDEGHKKIVKVKDSKQANKIIPEIKKVAEKYD
jgi:hypothetical protein